MDSSTEVRLSGLERTIERLLKKVEELKNLLRLQEQATRELWRGT